MRRSSILFAMLTITTMCAEEQGVLAVYYRTQALHDVACVRVEPQVAMAPAAKTAPAPDVPVTRFSVRWQGWIVPTRTGDHTISVAASDGVRLWLDGAGAIDAWAVTSGVPTRSVTVAMTAGVPVRFTLENYHHDGTPRCQLYWQATGLTKALIPSTSLLPVADVQPPSTPGAPAPTWVGDRVATIAWPAVADDVGIATYRVLRDGVAIASTSVPWYRDAALEPQRSYRYAVIAEDVFAKASAPGPAIDVVTTAPASSGVTAVYFTNKDLNDVGTVRVDPVIDLASAYKAPAPGLPDQDYSILWQGWIIPDATDEHTFSLVHNDGIRFWLDGELVIDWWQDVNNTRTSTARRALTAGVPVRFRIEYFQNSGGSRCQLSWQSGLFAKEPIPSTHLRPLVDAVDPAVPGAPTADLVADRVAVLSWAPSSDDVHVAAYRIERDGVVIAEAPLPTWRDATCQPDTAYVYRVAAVDVHGNASGWSQAVGVTTLPAVVAGSGRGLRGAYHNGEAFADRVTTRIDPELDLTWPAEPAPAVLADGFTVCWEGFIEPFYTETYRLETLADDGVRVFIDGVLVIDSWGATQSSHGWAGQALTRSCEVALVAGHRHAIRIDHIDLADEARLRLRWESLRQPLEVVPASQLHPADDPSPTTLALLTPTESRTSPAWIEGSVGDASALVSATAGEDAVDVVRTHPQAWHLSSGGADAPAGLTLAPDAPTQVRIVAADGTSAQELALEVAWTVTDLTALPYGLDSLSIRRGDSLLLTAGGSGAALALDVTGDGIADAAGVPNCALPVRFDQPGPVRVTAWIDGVAVGALDVNVVSVDFDGPIACSLTHWRTKTVAVSERIDADAPGNGVVFLSGAPRRFQVKEVGGTATTRDLKLQALYPGELTLEARLGGANGPLIGSQPIDEFELRTTAEKTVRVVEVFPDGSMLAEAELVMTPLVPDLDVRLRTFIAGVTFADGTIHFACSSNAFTAGSGSGTCAYQLIRGPSVTAGLCHTLHVLQRGVMITY